MQPLISIISKKFNVDGHYFLSGGFWLVVAQASTVLSSLVVAILFARYLSETEYGVYRYIIGLAALLSAFSLTGIGQAILQAASRGYRSFLRESTALTLKWSLGIVVISLAGTAYYAVQGNSLLATGCLLIAIFHPISQLFLNTLSHLYGEMRFQAGAIMQSLKSVFVSGSSLVALFLTQNILILIAVYFTSQAVAAIACYLIYRPQVVSTNKTPQDAWGEYINYAKHSSFRNIFVGVATRLDAVIVFQFLGAAELALYSIATLLPDQIRGSFKNLQTLLLPRYTKHDSLDTLKRFIPKRSVQFFAILTIITLGVIVITPILYPLLFPKYMGAILYVQLLALSFPASIFLLPLGALQAQRMEKKLYAYHLSTSLVQILSLGILILLFGFLGAIISRIITQYSRTIIAFVLLYR